MFLCVCKPNFIWTSGTIRLETETTTWTSIGPADKEASKWCKHTNLLVHICVFFYIASCIWYIAQHTKTLPLPSLHMTGPWFYHINALQNTENWRFCGTTWVRRSETQGQSTGGRPMTFIDILHLLKIVGDALHELFLFALKSGLQ